MLVTMINGSKTLNGHTTLFHEYLRGLDSVGIEHQVITCIDPSDESEYPHEGTLVRGWQFPGGGRLEMGINRLFPILARRIRHANGDLIHVNDIYLARVSAYRNNVITTLADISPFTTRLHPFGPSFVHNFSLRYVPKCRGFVCLTRFVRDDVIQNLRIPEDRVHVAPLYSLLPPIPEPTRPPPPPNDGAPWTLLYVAADRPNKNIPGFLSIVKSLDERFRGLLISRLRPRSQKAIRENGLASRITVLEKVPDILSAYRRAHILVYPSIYEGFGLPIVEAMSQGIPVVASERTAMLEVVGSAGALLDPEDPAAWREAILRRTEPAEYLRWSRAAWEQARTFNALRTGKALQGAYEAALAG